MDISCNDYVGVSELFDIVTIHLSYGIQTHLKYDVRDRLLYT